MTINQDALLQKDYITVEVVFNQYLDIDDIIDNEPPCKDLRKYTYKAEQSLNLQVGDLVAVHANHGVQIAQIAKVHQSITLDTDAEYAYKWVIDKIDTTNFIKRQKEQEQLNELLMQIKFAKQKQALYDELETASKNNTVVADKWQKLKEKLFS